MQISSTINDFLHAHDVKPQLTIAPAENAAKNAQSPIRGMRSKIALILQFEQ